METTMTTLEHAAGETGRPGFGPAGFAGRALRLLHKAIRLRSDRAAMLAMPDYLLKDMGIARSEIDHYTSMRYAIDADGMDIRNAG
jgi:uncharacterized protein YjiS (DUF1127 family)